MKLETLKETVAAKVASAKVWASSHKPQTAGIAAGTLCVAALCAVGVGYALMPRADAPAPVDKPVQEQPKKQPVKLDAEEAEQKVEVEKAKDEADVDGEPVATASEADAGDGSATDESGSAPVPEAPAAEGSGPAPAPQPNPSPAPAPAPQPEKDDHQHSWQAHTAERTVDNWVDVPTYEQQQVATGHLFTFWDGYTTTDPSDAKAYSVALVKKGLDSNFSEEVVYETQTVQTGTHKENHPTKETYTDYEYCNCGATR